MLDNSDELLERYRQVRQVSRGLASNLVARVPREAIIDSARKLGLWQDGQLVFQNERDACILYDFCIYDWRGEGNTLAEEMLQSAPPPEEGSQEYDVLE